MGSLAVAAAAGAVQRRAWKTEAEVAVLYLLSCPSDGALDTSAFVEKISLAMNTVARRGISVTLLPTYNCNFRCEYCRIMQNCSI